MMETKTYRASSMTEALTEVRRELGHEAVILHTRSRREGGLFGWLGGKPVWEVTASKHVNVVPRPPSGRYVSDQVQVDDDGGQATDDSASVELGGDTYGAGQLSEIHSMLRDLTQHQPGQGQEQLPHTLRDLHERLCAQSVHEPLVDELIASLQMDLTGQDQADPATARARLVELIAARIRHSHQARPSDHKSLRGRTIALVGPTGVGKTTTIAKLAANMKLKEGKRVGLITIDTYRIAAVDQLRTYADIIEVPLHMVATPREMTQALYAMRGLDSILIDTVGRSQNDQLRLSQLRTLLDAADADEVHLVISGTTNHRCAANIVTRFTPLGVNRIILTKLDEAEAYGVVLNVARGGEAPLSYVSAGQEVPDDIAPADPHELARRIVGDSANAA